MACACQEDVRQSARGQTLFAVSYMPQSATPLATLVWHHGYGEHVGRYDHVFRHLAAASIAVFSYDAFCFGKSDVAKDEHQRGYLENFDHFVDDFIALAEEVKAKYAAAPLFIGGQSMGGLVACHTVLRKQDLFAGLILHSASLDVHMTPLMRVQNAVGGLINILVPKARLVAAVRPEDMSQDPAVVKDYLEDPFVYSGKLRVRTAMSIQKAFLSLRRRYKEFKLPIYAAHGTVDRCTLFEAVQLLLDTCSSNDKTLFSVEGGYHELLHGPEKQEVLMRLQRWILDHASATQGQAATKPVVTSNL